MQSAHQISDQDNLATSVAVSPYRTETLMGDSVDVQVSSTCPVPSQAPSKLYLSEPNEAQQACLIYDHCLHCNQYGHLQAICPQLFHPKATGQW